MITAALRMRAVLEQSGLDYGPLSVIDRMRDLGMSPPSRATLARRFAQAGVVVPEPRKRPRSAFRRFTYPAPNCLWQLDATEYVLAGGRKCVIFQLIDDHSRYAVASHVDWSETSAAALAVVDKGITAHGVPQKLLTDNALALNPTRRGVRGQLVDYLASLGCEAITGKPYKPTTQGKNERFHRTLFRWLDKQPLAGSLEQLQQQVDQFDRVYNTERRHQALPGRCTPQQAWQATPKAEPPPPRPASPEPPASPANPTGHASRTVAKNGSITVLGVQFTIDATRAGQTLQAIWDASIVDVFDADGTHLISFPRPPKGTRWIPKSARLSPKS